MAPEANIDDGLLDVVILNQVTRRRLLSALPKIFTGAHLRMPEVEHFVARKASFRPSATKALTPDGEIIGATPITVSVLPGSLQVFG